MKLSRVKVLYGRVLVLAVVAGSLLCVVLILSFVSKSPTPQSLALVVNNAADHAKNEQAIPGIPVRLLIPRININATIEPVGITSKGEMDVPKSPANAAWYNQGPRPGEKGSAVLDGHFGYKDNVPAVFDNLSKLRSGDKLYIKDQNGATYTFVVRESHSYDPQADTSGVFRSSDGKSHLNLITCEGVWDSTLKSYSNRLVVFADEG